MLMNALTLCPLAYSSPPLTAKPDYPEILQSYCSEIMIILLWINFTINNLNAFLRHIPPGQGLTLALRSSLIIQLHLLI